MDPITQQEALAAAGAGTGSTVGIEEVFSTKLYAGTGATQTITNGIDLAGEGGAVWFKVRDYSDSHTLQDSERKTGTYHDDLTPNETNASQTSRPWGISSMNSDGFTIGGSNAQINSSSYNYISWTFRKAPKFFDIVTYTGNGVAGREISHNLGSTPGMVIVKRTNTTEDWTCYHRELWPNDIIDLNTSNAKSNSGDVFDSTAPTSSVFTVGSSSRVNSNGSTYVAYIFGHDDLIQCGSYTGTDSSNNVNVGFKPQFVMIKRASGAGNWVMLDSTREPNRFYANDNNSEASDAPAWGGFTSTGFNVSGGTNDYNNGGHTYIYMAIKAPDPYDYQVGTYYPMFAVKAADVSSDAVPSVDCEVPMRRALSFDTANTTRLIGDETLSEITSILDISKYTCNPDFGSGGNKISGIMIKHCYGNGSLYSGGQGSFEFDSTSFNIYDDACNVTAVPSQSPDGTGSMNAVARACGNIYNIALSDLPSGFSGSLYAYLNQSSQRTGEAQATGAGWSSDNGDYAFIAICTQEHMTDTDALDTQLSGNNNTNPGLAFGISDSEGRGTGSETTPREGISRRSTYPSLTTNCLVEKAGAESSHAGHTIEGYFIVYGKYLSS